MSAPVDVSYTLDVMGYEVGPPWGSERSELQDPNWAALYPDLVQSGGLSPALQHLFQQFSADVEVAKKLGPDKINPGWAFVHKGSRRSQVCIALYERCFIVDFWNFGWEYGRGSTDDLAEVARATVIFLVQEGSTARMKSEFGWFKGFAGERILNEPAASFVTECWQSLERWLKSEKCPSAQRQLLPLISEAAKRPQLRQLVPFMSMYRLRFSRTTNIPGVPIDCIAWPMTNGLFRVITGLGTVLGEGDAVQAANILIANLPPNCGPAIHGTEWKE